MAVNEKRRHQLFTRAEEVFGPDEAETMMELIGPVAGDALVTRSDLAAALGGLESRLTRTFVTWLLASQTGLVAIVAIVVSAAG